MSKALILKADIPERLARTATVKYKQCGNIVEAVWVSRRNTKVSIKRIDKDHYIHLATGEVREYQHSENRADDMTEVRRSLRRLRDYINTNVTDTRRVRWITLTYAENMTDTRRLYTDFDKFMKRLRYKLGKCEYIVAAEPQGRGAWHLHLLLIFDCAAPFIPNAELRDIWGHGFVKVTALDNVDNVGAYLTAYLGDMEYNGNASGGNIKEITTKDGKSKRVIKGARLKLYPKGFNLFRKSKGIKPPTVENITEHELQMRTASVALTYEYALGVVFEDENAITIYYRFYHLKKPRKTAQGGAA